MTRSEPCFSIFLDSGAYSAWRRQEDIPLSEYIRYVERHRDVIDVVVGLDVIAGHFGKKHLSVSEMRESAERSFRNTLEMRRAGIDAMPVYHQGEGLDWLKRMLDEGIDYIGISNQTWSSRDSQVAWLDMAFDYLCGRSGWPVVRTHGFGLTSMPLVRRYPYYSCDSTSWILTAGNGMIVVPMFDHRGRPDFSASPRAIRMSRRATAINYESTEAQDTTCWWDSLGGTTQSLITSWVSRYGFTPGQLRENYHDRGRYMVRYMTEAVSSMKVRPFRLSAGVLFSGNRNDRPGGSRPDWACPSLYFAADPNRPIDRILTEAGVRRRLISFHWIRRHKLFDLREYAMHGPEAAPRRAASSPVRQRRKRKETVR